MKQSKIEDSMWILQVTVLMATAVAVVLFASETFF